MANKDLDRVLCNGIMCYLGYWLYNSSKHHDGIRSRVATKLDSVRVYLTPMRPISYFRYDFISKINPLQSQVRMGLLKRTLNLVDHLGPVKIMYDLNLIQNFRLGCEPS